MLVNSLALFVVVIGSVFMPVSSVLAQTHTDTVTVNGETRTVEVRGLGFSRRVLLERVAQAYGFEVSGQASAALSQAVTGRHSGTLPEVLGWLLPAENFVIVYGGDSGAVIIDKPNAQVRRFPDPSTPVARVVLERPQPSIQPLGRNNLRTVWIKAKRITRAGLLQRLSEELGFAVIGEEYWDLDDYVVGEFAGTLDAVIGWILDRESYVQIFSRNDSSHLARIQLSNQARRGPLAVDGRFRDRSISAGPVSADSLETSWTVTDKEAGALRSGTSDVRAASSSNHDADTDAESGNPVARMLSDRARVFDEDAMGGAEMTQAQAQLSTQEALRIIAQRAASDVKALVRGLKDAEASLER